MALRTEHDLHRRRRGRNIGLMVVLLGFAALVFGLTIVKITNGDMMEGFDHQPRVSVLPREEAPTPSPTATTEPLAEGTTTGAAQ